jgi:hypothetical protein
VKSIDKIHSELSEAYLDSNFADIPEQFISTASLMKEMSGEGLSVIGSIH